MKSHARRFVHWAEDHQRVGHDSSLLHLVPKFVPFANAFSDAGKHGHALM